MSSLATSMRPVASFIFENKSDVSKKLCLIPGHFNTAKLFTNVIGASAPFQVESFLTYSDPASIKAAGYECDQVADDSSLSGGIDFIKITPKSNKTRYRDFLSYIKASGLKVAKMRITDLSAGANPSRDIFNSEIEVSQSAIGSKAGSDFIQLSAHIDPSNYLQNFIEVDLERQNLLLDETTLAFLEVPGSAKFQIDFTLAPTL